MPTAAVSPCTPSAHLPLRRQQRSSGGGVQGAYAPVSATACSAAAPGSACPATRLPRSGGRRCRWVGAAAGWGAGCVRLVGRACVRRWVWGSPTAVGVQSRRRACCVCCLCPRIAHSPRPPATIPIPILPLDPAPASPASPPAGAGTGREGYPGSYRRRARPAGAHDHAAGARSAAAGCGLEPLLLLVALALWSCCRWWRLLYLLVLSFCCSWWWWVCAAARLSLRWPCIASGPELPAACRRTASVCPPGLHPVPPLACPLQP